MSDRTAETSAADVLHYVKPRQACETCRFARSGLVHTGQGTVVSLTCHRHPPGPQPYWNFGQHFTNGWPAVGDSDWCGEWDDENRSESSEVL